MIDLVRRLDAVEDLPGLPGIYERIAELAEDPSASASRFAEVIAADPSIAAKLLRLVNSPIYGFPGRIASLTRAIVVLGFENLRQVLLLTSVVDLFPTRSGRALDRAAFWEHALATGLIARSIAVGRQERAEEVFVAGLLHDVGQLVADHLEPDAYAGVLARVREERRPLVEVEAETFGIDHAALGAALLERWRLPRQLVEVVRCHHRPSAATLGPDWAYTVQVADALAIGVGWGFSANPWVPRIAPDALERLGLGVEVLVDVLAAAERDLAESRALFQSESAR